MPQIAASRSAPRIGPTRRSSASRRRRRSWFARPRSRGGSGQRGSLVASGPTSSSSRSRSSIAAPSRRRSRASATSSSRSFGRTRSAVNRASFRSRSSPTFTRSWSSSTRTWPKRIASHLNVDGLWLEYASQPLGPSDRKRGNAVALAPVRRLLAALHETAVPDPPTAAVVAETLRAEASVMSTLGDFGAADQYLERVGELRPETRPPGLEPPASRTR